MRRLLTILLSIFTMTVSAQTTQLLGGPGIKVLNRGDFQVDSIFYLPRTLVTSRAPSQAGALRYQASDSTLYQWTGTAWRKITTDADTLLLSTRAWRQKGDDSVAALVAAKVNISDTATMLSPYLRKADTTAMLNPYVRIAGYGLTKGTQTLSVDTGLMATRAWRQKGNDSIISIVSNGYVPYVGANANLDLDTFDIRAYDGRFAFVYANAPSQDGQGAFSPLVQDQATGLFQAATYDSLRSFLKIATGTFSLDRGLVNITGNTAIGNNVLRSLAVGVDTIKLGNLPDTSTIGATFQGGYNTGVGLAALGANIYGSDNTAVGANALQNNTVGFYNSAFGHLALGANVRGWKNTGVGAFSMFNSTSGTNLTGVGFRSLANNTTGSYNTAIGNDALVNNTTGYRNNVLGAYGGQQLTTGNNNTLIGYANFTDLTTGNNNTVIGSSVVAPSSSTNNNIILADGVGNIKARHDSINWNFNSNYTSFTGGISANGGLRLNKDSIDIATGRTWALYVDTTNGKLVRQSLNFLNTSDTSTMLNPYTRGTGTTNYLPKFTGTRTFGNSQIFDNGTNVGINTTNPAARLHVFGINEQDGDAHGQIITRSTQAFNATPRSGIIFQITTDSDGNGSYVGSIYSQKDNTSNGNRASSMIFSTRSSSGTATERMRITSGGTLSVGTSTPDAGTISHIARSSDGTISTFRRSGGTINPGIRIESSETDNTISFNTNYQGATSPAIRFLTQENERLRIFANGRIGINTTSDVGYQLMVSGSARFTDSIATQNRLRVGVIDSSSSPINMLWADNSGVIRKAPVASGGLTGTGISGYVPRFTSSSAVDTSSIFISNGRVALGSTTVSNGGLSVYNGNIFTNRKFVRGAPQDTGRIFAMVGSGNEGSMIIEEYNTSTNGPEIFQRKGRGTPDAKSNVEVGDAIGGYDFGGYVDGSLNTSALVTASVTEVDTLNNIAYSNLLIRQSYNNTTQTNATFKSSNGGLEIRGDLKVGSIDSTSSAINMLYADANGVIKKTAVPSGSTDSVKMRTASITAASGFTLAKEASTGTTIDQVVGFVDASGLTTVKLNGAVYKTTATFTTGSWVTIATIAEYRPNNDVYFSLPNLVSGESFESAGNVDFTAAAAYSGATSLRVRTNGDIQVYVGSVDASADLSSANYVILPIVVSYPILTILN